MPDTIALGLESTCDETAAALVSETGRILANVVFGQVDLHAAFGGVVPEIAARAHAERLPLVAHEALRQAGLPLSRVDVIAAAAGPGLIGGVAAGLAFAKGLAAGAGKTCLAINHLEAHALTPRLSHALAFPWAMLLVSGGHCQILFIEGLGRYRRMGSTRDDAAGEAFDKVARLLGLPQPGGPEVERAARTGDGARFALPRPLRDEGGLDMSFSGLKTALKREFDALCEKRGSIDRQDRADLCASFQCAVCDVLVAKTHRAMARFREMLPQRIRPVLAVAGGVAANAVLRAALERTAREEGFAFCAPPLALCGDNGAIVAWAALEHFQAGRRDGWGALSRPRWPLGESVEAHTAFRAKGTAAKGVKA